MRFHPQPAPCIDLARRARGLRRPLVTALAVLTLHALPLSAQFAQYTAPGEVKGRPESRQVRLDDAMENARWRLGPVRLDPWLGLKDVGWVDNLSGSTAGGSEDAVLTATAGAGLRAYLPTGPKAVWAAHVLPEYVWYQDNADLNQVNGRYGVGLFGFFNHLEVEATATRSQAIDIITSELPARVNTRGDAVALAAELRLGGALHLFAAAQEQRTENLDEPLAGGVDFALLDRTERTARAGLRWRSRRGWAVGLGAERSDVEFERPPADRSNAGTAPVLVISAPGEKLYIDLDLAYRSLDPEGGSDFVPYTGLTGSFEIGLGNELSRLEPGFYVRRNLVYTLATPGATYFEDDRIGLTAGVGLGSRTRLRAFVEAGRNDFTAADPAFTRVDDLRAFGLSAELGWFGTNRLSLGISRLEITSDQPGADRSVTFVRAGMSFGSGPAAWY